jgi:hypothetical protein
MGDQPWEWNHLDHSRAAQLLSRHVSSDSHTRLEPFGSGDFSLAFKQGDQVIRVARHTEAAAVFRQESCVQAKLAAGLLLPSIRDWSDVWVAKTACDRIGTQPS